MTSVINFTRLLQTLDNDSNPNNGILLREYRTKLLDASLLDFKSKDFVFNIENLLGNTLVDVDAAMKHLHYTLELSTDNMDEIVENYITLYHESSSSENLSSSSSIAAIAKSGAELFSKCSACHGTDGMKNPLGKPVVISGQDINELIDILKMYKAGTRNNHEMGALMQGQVLGYSTSEINAVSGYISTLK